MICSPSTLDPFLKGLSPVLDLGCGPGDYLLHLKGAGIRASGLDLDADNVKAARAQGLETEQGNAFEILPKYPGKFGAIVMSHLIEHFNGSDAGRLLGLCQDALQPGGCLVLLTPNPKNLKVISSLFWEDPTHVRPYSTSGIGKLLRVEGWRIVTIRELPEPPGSLTWRVRDALRRALVGPFWGSQEILAVAERS